ncbi:MAG TPA: hypothetical protein VIN11_04225, partial [Roseivirga sp.]
MKLQCLSFLLFISTVSTPQVFGQDKWRQAYYEVLNDESFRKFPLFSQYLDVKQIDYPLLHAAIFFVSNEARLEQGLNTVQYQHNL